ncbi:hypothetical protein [Bacillus sp. Marseille-Q1617]|uniref:hypothetical protein n=1 Tax=Bacillus sp. Marseille-Q1617 TaxID=2736887 RepID=UPI00158DFDA8|nr:hypothetical protein [Bacillus sp. Marseille-Q1617]
MNNERDPLFTLKEDLDKELFDKIEITSQKRRIMSKIHHHHPKKKINWYIFLNIGVIAAFICLLSILGSSYLSNEELTEEDPGEEIQIPDKPDQPSTFIPEDDLKDEIKKEKRELRKKEQPAVEDDKTDPAPSNEDEEEESEKEEPKQRGTTSPAPPFDFSFILQNPTAFKAEASQGILHGVNIVIGESFDSITEKYGNLPFASGTEGGYKHNLGSDYLLTFDEKGDGILHRVEVKRRTVTNLTVEQMVNALGIPYFYHDAMSTGEIYMAYIYGDYQLTMRVEGDVELRQRDTNADLDVVFVDSAAKLTTLQLSRKWLDETLLNKNTEIGAREE